MKLYALAAVLFLALGPLAGAEPPTVPDGPRAVVVHCNIFNDTLEINGSESDLLLLIGGEVRVDFVQLVSVKVTLTPSSDKAWNLSVFPKEMTFTASSAQGFRANLTIPKSTYNTTCNVTVRADAIVLGVPADFSQDSVIVNVFGPSQTPVIPPIKKPGGNGGLTPVNMPVVVFAASLAAIVGAFLTFALFKHRRLRRDKSKGPKPSRKTSDDDDITDEQEEEVPAPPPRKSKTGRRPARKDYDNEQVDEAPQDEPDEEPAEAVEEVVEVVDETKRKRNARPRRDE